MTVLSDFIPISILFKLLFGQCSMCTNILQVHFPTSPAAPLLRWLTTQKTDRQYIYYAKNVKRCLPRETICVEHDTLMGLRVSSSHGNNLSNGKHLQMQYTNKKVFYIQWSTFQEPCMLGCDPTYRLQSYSGASLLQRIYQIGLKL